LFYSPFVRPVTASSYNISLTLAYLRRERIALGLDRLQQLKKQTKSTASIAVLFDQHGTDDPQLWPVQMFLDSLTPREQQGQELIWESVSQSPLPSEPYATHSMLNSCRFSRRSHSIFLLSLVFSRSRILVFCVFRDWGVFASVSDMVGLRQAGAYVDKTEQLSVLLRFQRAQYIFLRPRRWGKSTLIDSLAQYFYGHKAVFKVRFLVVLYSLAFLKNLALLNSLIMASFFCSGLFTSAHRVVFHFSVLLPV
jgi:hypothetical protein